MRVLVADDDLIHRTMAADALKTEGIDVHLVESAEQALAALRDGQHFDAIVTDYMMTGMTGLDLIRTLGPPPGAPPIVLVTGMGDERIVREAFLAGAKDYMTKDTPRLAYLEVLPTILRKVVKGNEVFLENLRLKEQVAQLSGSGPIVAASSVMKQILDMVHEVAAVDSTVLISGESGTGKELIARSIHNQSPRANNPFVATSCAAFPESLLESELFGHEAGAFTGARGRKIGRFERAQRGTIFLDEISEISPKAQVDLLRVLQEHQLERIGGEELIDLDVRVLAATNKDLEECVRSGTFRADLYYRLNVIPIRIPPLRERRDDIAPLAYHFLKRFAERQTKPIEDFSDAALTALTDFAWRGNVRELENTIERAVFFSRLKTIDVRDLPETIQRVPQTARPLEDNLASVERATMLRVLNETEWNRYQAAKRLGISRTTLYSKIEKHKLIEPGKK